MGNCLKGSSADDISLLRGSESGNDTSSDNLGLPPPYRVCFFSELYLHIYLVFM